MYERPDLADTVGLDICKSVANILSAALDIKLPANLQQLSDNKLGKKTGEGFYKYKNRKPIRNKNASYPDPQEVQDRLVLRLLNEATACLREGIVEGQELIDAGVIFGTGFAPFRGGPVNHIRNEGVEALTGIMSELEKTHGNRFARDEGWSTLY